MTKRRAAVGHHTPQVFPTQVRKSSADAARCAPHARGRDLRGDVSDSRFRVGIGSHWATRNQCDRGGREHRAAKQGDAQRM